MKLFNVILLSCLLTLSITSCTVLPPSSFVSSAVSDATCEAAPRSTEPAAIQIKLERVTDEIKAEDGQLLVSYAYDRPTVAIPYNTTAQTAIQSSLNALVEQDLNYVTEELRAIAQENYQSMGKDAHPCTSELNLQVTRSDDTVISLVVDEIQYAGGAHGNDWRSGWNYDTQTGQQLTFSDLGDTFRTKATELITQQADETSDSLFENYQENISHVVLDGTENAQALYGFDTTIAPTFYMNDNAIVFISREYELQPFSSGVLEFATDYSDYGIALNARYIPEQDTDDDSAQASLDGQAEETESAGNETTSATTPSNGKTLAQAGILLGNGWMLTIPSSWEDQIYVDAQYDSISFYEKGCYDATGNGWLFSIEAYPNDNYQQLPDYELLSIDRNIRYVAAYPTDVQFEGADQKSAQRYSAFAGQIEKVLKTFSLSS